MYLQCHLSDHYTQFCIHMYMHITLSLSINCRNNSSDYLVFGPDQVVKVWWAELIKTTPPRWTMLSLTNGMLHILLSNFTQF